MDPLLRKIRSECHDVLFTFWFAENLIINLVDSLKSLIRNRISNDFKYLVILNMIFA